MRYGASRQREKELMREDQGMLRHAIKRLKMKMKMYDKSSDADRDWFDKCKTYSSIMQKKLQAVFRFVFRLNR